MVGDSSSIWMIFMALTLGLRHGLDLDHLATIDAITRTVRNRHYLSKMVGFLFSLGHGLVVILISLIIGSGLMKAHTPPWLEGFGNWISIFFLIVFGLLNLWTVFQGHSQSTLPDGVGSFFVKKFISKKYNPALIIMIGALFALSFDTFSQIALFSITASLMSGWIFSAILGIFFTLGMMISDGFNGLFVSALIQRADGMSLVLSRGLGLAISFFSLITGIIGLIKILL